MVTLSIESLDVALGRRAVLHGISATLAPGSLVGVIGPNGAGKSTLVRAMRGLVPAAAGRILIDGQPITTIPDAAIARRVAYLPQGQVLHWPLSVERLVALGRLPHLAPFSAIGPQDQAAIDRALRRTDIAHLRARDATQLSGGERARALLARALAVEAPALIVDEPLGSLDPGHQMEVMELLRAQATAGTLVVAVLHDLSMAARFCDRVLLLDEGRLVADGAPEQVLTAQRIAAVYRMRVWTGAIEGQAAVVPLRARAD
ncbi:ABC transporter ATP-binding protein [Sphingobium algorifonticola]|uniref:ABC transporter ATP-binding protein n=1 Tax=Sphingobium algorifonticola TaxID=2008318 RepID=A0A437JD75_9SPHN|nr:ABC transporter ATP-binding protein [Sphingobium algorifonticola]RVT43693.1 ABC transporter ATP-binding protein [Sphingobium algorifonticola]